MPTPKNWRKCRMSYNPHTNTVYIWANVEDFVPTFLKYLLEYHHIPTNALTIFKGWETPPHA